MSRRPFPTLTNSTGTSPCKIYSDSGKTPKIFQENKANSSADFFNHGSYKKHVCLFYNETGNLKVSKGPPCERGKKKKGHLFF